MLSKINLYVVLQIIPALSVASAIVNHKHEPSTSYHSDAGVLEYVNPKIGTYGTTPNGNGGMIPSVCPPFGMTRWTPQTRENFISQCPYNDADGYIHGFQATHQPAIWMGESGQVVLSPGWGDVKPLFQDRGMKFQKQDETSTPYVYEVLLDADTNGSHGWHLTEEAVNGGPVPGGGQPVPDDVKAGANGRVRKRYAESPKLCAPEVESAFEEDETEISGRVIRAALSATSHVGHLRFEFEQNGSSTDQERGEPFVFVQATRQNWTGHVHIDASKNEVFGSNPERQDWALGPYHASGFRGYFVSRFSTSFTSYGIATKGNIQPYVRHGNGEFLGAFVKFPATTTHVEVRTGVSFVSVEQARKNLDLEIPDGTRFETTVENLKSSWLDKLGRVTIEGINHTSAAHDQRTIWYTGLFHALQYPNDYSEALSKKKDGLRTYYSGYTDSVHQSHDSYDQSWSIWDTYRAEHSLLTIFAPERINSLMSSLVKIFDWSGRLPMWANVVETNIMIGTHVDAVIANALERGFSGFDVKKAWEGVKKNAFEPPERDRELLYYDREPHTPFEVRAGLSAYMKKSYVPNDHWAESASRTLDYSFDDYAASVVAAHAGAGDVSQKLKKRSNNYRTLWNAKTAFMQARNGNGTWANNTYGWTEGDHWVYTFDVMHDVPGLAALFGSNAKLKAKLDAHFEGGHNEHSNEPSHHVPYLYSMIGYPASTQRWVREIAFENYNATSAGLSGNEDLGQMSAWYVFSALGFYPVNPASDEYVVGSPFFEKVTIRLPAGAATGGDVDAEGASERELVISAPDAPTKPYIKSLKVDGKPMETPVLRHSQIVRASRIDFEMADTPQTWGTKGR